ncbi:sel1 repeat family protein [Treponema phagedenis]|uniref:Sel1 repeat protein n=1 Tax=Treponema phagedenis TaxID=162 RepID=A0A0B7GVH7_TREPH|nr:SEL1-like repeat protein [Treponema phagedenis]EFW36442.1 Sel1 repeat protein [Treponema phagedenis F0421]QEK00974.1 SEL1-like repeat protein [Treponema phagedenis]QEK05983.1 SEL1-like repeat protein [Treponema phagedenis]QSH99292.1 sel1 repeat family protein [Treponema phagedenis]TYT76627.1 SEL1-like repeat protein [Treponema phagedenis]
MANNEKFTFSRYLPAVEQGDFGVQCNPEDIRYDGSVFVSGMKQTFLWMIKCAEQGDVTTQYNLAIMYSYGGGAPLDKKQAAYWFRKAYENGYKEEGTARGKKVRKGKN